MNVLLLLIHCLLFHPMFVGFFFWFGPGLVVRYILSFLVLQASY